MNNKKKCFTYEMDAWFESKSDKWIEFFGMIDKTKEINVSVNSLQHLKQLKNFNNKYKKT